MTRGAEARIDAVRAARGLLVTARFRAREAGAVDLGRRIEGVIRSADRVVSRWQTSAGLAPKGARGGDRG